MISKHTRNEPAINMKKIFNLNETAPDEPMGAHDPLRTTEGWKSPLDLEAFSSSPLYEEAPRPAEADGDARRGNHARETIDRRACADGAALRGSHAEPMAAPDEPASVRTAFQAVPGSLPSKTPREPNDGMTKSSLRSTVERAEEMSSVLAEAMMELSRKTESAHAIAQNIDHVANEAIERIESTIRKSFDANPLRESGGALGPDDLEKLEASLADMLEDEYKRHARSLASAAASQANDGNLKDSELWDSLTLYISEKMSLLESELEKKMMQSGAGLECARPRRRRRKVSRGAVPSSGAAMQEEPEVDHPHGLVLFRIPGGYRDFARIGHELPADLLRTAWRLSDGPVSTAEATIRIRHAPTLRRDPHKRPNGCDGCSLGPELSRARTRASRHSRAHTRT